MLRRLLRRSGNDHPDYLSQLSIDVDSTGSMDSDSLQSFAERFFAGQPPNLVGGRTDRASGEGGTGRLSSFARVLEEADRVMPSPPAARAALNTANRAQNTPNRRTATNRSYSTTQQTTQPVTMTAPTTSDTDDLTVPRFTSMPESVHMMCSNAVTRIYALMRSVARRVEERRAFPDEAIRTTQIVEIILGIRTGFNDSDIVNRTTRTPRTMTHSEMVTILLNMHHDHPEWRQNDQDDIVLQNFHTAIEDGDLVGMLQLLPRMRHPIYHRDVAGETALHVACLHGREEEVQLLLDMGHSADMQCLDGSTPLADAASGGFANIVALLALRTPHCINMVDIDGDGPLHNAARGDYGDVCRILLEAGADTTVRNSDGDLPIDYCEENSRCRRLLSSRLAGVDGRDREVLRLFLLYAESDVDNEGFSIVDLIALSDNRLSPEAVMGAVHRLMGLGALEARGSGDSHWALVDAATLAERGLVYE